MSEVEYRLGIDVGGTKIEGIVLDPAGATVFRERVATESARGYDHVLDRLAELYARMRERIGSAAHTLGIGTPGAVSTVTGRLKNSNTTSLNGQPIQSDIERRIGRLFRIENDANCFALAEALLGAGRGYDMVFGVIMGTGCGGGIVWHGELHRGGNRIAGEWGHTVIDPRGAPCYCGARGCVETRISGSGLERRYREHLEHRSGGVAPTGAGGAPSLIAEDIVGRWRAGEAEAAAVMDSFFAGFGQALANLINVLDPDVIVLGGGLSNIDELYTRGVREVRARVFGGDCDTPVVRHALGDSGGVIGAALIGA